MAVLKFGFAPYRLRRRPPDCQEVCRGSSVAVSNKNLDVPRAEISIRILTPGGTFSGIVVSSRWRAAKIVAQLDFEASPSRLRVGQVHRDPANYQHSMCCLCEEHDGVYQFGKYRDRRL
jgi:hypothetical protein